ncbi:hypothetical protein GTCCBUS3UF5_390 [Geobacillus thermoleovorans CCB_US3_UF5]|uniref:Uncharacterized protein n=2 Tax=Geobacillus thermoleovorans group TaxID=1505648 RepID=U2YAV3_GEOKU|nr:hypothetical protein GTCCBUS3UF5_390 [Geobacillus thermoleovorans CCB_US3_UF5]EPR29798.1 hypothetical protein I656_00489 [Geobacillus sp. WSUCF1]GAD14018.1 hypothetical protein GBL_2235 [Geobacillus kaustophilus GBlys]GAJ56984.1 hypothetical protein B23_0173 [Geobacillus thermoleovorans B23]
MQTEKKFQRNSKNNKGMKRLSAMIRLTFDFTGKEALQK